MNKYFQLVTVLPIAAFLLSGCRDKKGTYYPITSNMLREAATIKDGSYFVYKDSISGAEDSFWVSRYEYYSFVSTQNNNTAESIVYVMTSNSGQEISVVLGGADDIAANRLVGGYSLNFNSRNFPLGVSFLQDPFIVGGGYKTTISTISNLDFKNSFIINSQIYDSVFITQSVSLSSVNGQPDSSSVTFTSYYSLRNGLVKYEVTNNQIHHKWELQRSQIVK